MLPGHVDFEGIAAAVSQTELFDQAAGETTQSAQPAAVALMDGVVWSGRDAAAYADAFKIRAELAESHSG
jgi:hypothetical protein